MGFVARVVAEGNPLKEVDGAGGRLILGGRGAGRVVSLKKRRERRQKVKVDSQRQANFVVADEQLQEL